MIRCSLSNIKQGIKKAEESSQPLSIQTKDNGTAGIFVPCNSPIYGYILSMLNYDTIKKLRDINE